MMNIKIKELGIMEIFYKKESLGNNKDEYTGMYKIFYEGCDRRVNRRISMIFYDDCELGVKVEFYKRNDVMI